MSCRSFQFNLIEYKWQFWDGEHWDKLSTRDKFRHEKGVTQKQNPKVFLSNPWFWIIWRKWKDYSWITKRAIRGLGTPKGRMTKVRSHNLIFGRKSQTSSSSITSISLNLLSLKPQNGHSSGRMQNKLWAAMHIVMSGAMFHTYSLFFPANKSGGLSLDFRRGQPRLWWRKMRMSGNIMAIWVHALSYDDCCIGLLRELPWIALVVAIWVLGWVKI